METAQWHIKRKIQVTDSVVWEWSSLLHTVTKLVRIQASMVLWGQLHLGHKMLEAITASSPKDDTSSVEKYVPNFKQFLLISFYTWVILKGFQKFVTQWFHLALPWFLFLKRWVVYEKLLPRSKLTCSHLHSGLWYISVDASYHRCHIKTQTSPPEIFVFKFPGKYFHLKLWSSG